MFFSIEQEGGVAPVLLFFASRESGCNRLGSTFAYWVFGYCLGCCVVGLL